MSVYALCFLGQMAKEQMDLEFLVPRLEENLYCKQLLQYYRQKEIKWFNLPFNEINNFSFPDMEEDKFVIYP